MPGLSAALYFQTYLLPESSMLRRVSLALMSAMFFRPLDRLRRRRGPSIAMPMPA